MADDEVKIDTDNLTDGERRFSSMSRYVDSAVDKANTILVSPVKPGEFKEGKLLQEHVAKCAEAYLERLKAWDGFREKTGQKVQGVKHESILVEERSTEQADMDIVRDAGRELGANPSNGSGSINDILNGKDPDEGPVV